MKFDDFKGFVTRRNLVDLAVAVVVGTAFASLVSSLVSDLLTPLIAAVFGKPDFSALKFTINDSVFTYGKFLNALFTFLSVSLTIYFFVIKPLRLIEKHRAEGRDPTTKNCPFCISEVPIAATRCPACTSELTAGATPTAPGSL